MEQVIAAAGFDVLKPIRPGSWLFALSELDQSAIDLILDLDVFRYLEDDERGDPEAIVEHCSALSGGYWLYDGAIPILRPSCCGSLDNLSEWRAVLDHRSAKALTVWTGHPWVAARWIESRDGSDGLELYEAGDGAARDPEVFRVKRRALNEAVESAALVLEGELPRWIEALASRLPGPSEQEVKRCARHLLGL